MNVYVYVLIYTTIFQILLCITYTRGCYEDLLERMDSSNQLQDHPCYIAERKNVPRAFFQKRRMDLLCAKFYAYRIEGDEKVNLKGIRGNVARNHIIWYLMIIRDVCIGMVNWMFIIRTNSYDNFSHQLMTIRTY